MPPLSATAWLWPLLPQGSWCSRSREHPGGAPRQAAPQLFLKADVQAQRLSCCPLLPRVWKHPQNIPTAWKVQKPWEGPAEPWMHTWRLRARVRTAQEAEHSTKPARRRILLPRDSTMKTWKTGERGRHQGLSNCCRCFCPRGTTGHLSWKTPPGCANNTLVEGWWDEMTSKVPSNSNHGVTAGFHEHNLI